VANAWPIRSIKSKLVHVPKVLRRTWYEYENCVQKAFSNARCQMRSNVKRKKTITVSFYDVSMTSSLIIYRKRPNARKEPARANEG
jgi:hypothetical protein